MRVRPPLLAVVALVLAGCRGGPPPAGGSPRPVEADYANWLGEAVRAYPTGDDEPDTSCYQRALTRLVEGGLRDGRLHPRHGLTVETGGGRVVVPVRYIGTAWRPDEVAELVPASAVDVKKYLKRHHTEAGWGVPVVGVSRDAGLRGDGQRFTTQPRPITLTAVLRLTPEPTLDLFDTTQVRRVELGGLVRPLAADLSAPLARLGELAHAAGDARFLAPFRHPGELRGYDQLSMFEPRRIGTFPVVFVHGLRSDNLTWLDTLNDLRTDPEFTRRFQVMSFRYATGANMLTAAANLREQGEEWVRAHDPLAMDDPARAWVLVGYSLGGPVTRLAVTESGEAVWDAFSSRPLDALDAPPDARERLRRMYHFRPLVCVRTAVFIAGPFNGSTAIDNLLLRLTARFVHYPHEYEEEYHRLQADNPGVIRRPARGRPPNSLDLLRRDNWLLDAVRELPFADGLEVHTIVGDGGLGGRTDGLVPLHSARVPGADSETRIRMRHTEAQKHPRSVVRQMEILDAHAQRFGQPAVR